MLRADGITNDPIHLYRVVLRFLKAKGLVQHVGRQLRPRMTPAQFSAAARRAWRQTEAAPFEVTAP